MGDSAIVLTVRFFCWCSCVAVTQPMLCCPFSSRRKVGDGGGGGGYRVQLFQLSRVWFLFVCVCRGGWEAGEEGEE